MTRCWQVVLMGLVALWCCTLSPALCPEARAGTPPESDELSRVQQDLAKQSDQVSRIAGRLDGIEEATKRAAAAGEQAAKTSQEVVTTIGECTKFVTGLIAFVTAVLGLLGYKEWQNIRGVSREASSAVKTASDSADGAAKSADAAAKSLEKAQQSETRVEELHDRAQKAWDEMKDQLDKARAAVGWIENLRQRAEAAASAAAKVDPTKEVSAEERQALEEARRTSELLEDLGQELPAEAYVARGNYYYWLRDYNRALVAYDRGIELKPKFADAYYNRACAYSHLASKGEALSNLETAIKLDDRLRETARKDEGRHFDDLRDDAEFRKLVGLDEEGRAEEAGRGSG